MKFTFQRCLKAPKKEVPATKLAIDLFSFLNNSHLSQKDRKDLQLRFSKERVKEK
jgi:hypothetical protein